MPYHQQTMEVCAGDFYGQEAEVQFTISEQEVSDVQSYTEYEATLTQLLFGALWVDRSFLIKALGENEVIRIEDEMCRMLAEGRAELSSQREAA